jgi:hypothetical protein
MRSDMEERRQTPRVSAGPAQLALLPMTIPVQVVDISVVGVLLHCSQPLEPGTKASLRMNLWGFPFSADVEVRRVTPAPADGLTGGYRIGGMFVAITPEHRQLIERFASQ